MWRTNNSGANNRQPTPACVQHMDWSNLSARANELCTKCSTVWIQIDIFIYTEFVRIGCSPPSHTQHTYCAFLHYFSLFFRIYFVVWLLFAIAGWKLCAARTHRTNKNMSRFDHIWWYTHSHLLSVHGLHIFIIWFAAFFPRSKWLLFCGAHMDRRTYAWLCIQCNAMWTWHKWTQTFAFVIIRSSSLRTSCVCPSRSLVLFIVVSDAKWMALHHRYHHIHIVCLFITHQVSSREALRQTKHSPDPSRNG